MQLELQVVADNAAAVALYKSMGFTESGRNPLGFRSRTTGWQSLLLMRLELSAPTLSQARGLTRAYEKQADSIYQQMMTLLLGGSGEKHADV